MKKKKKGESREVYRNIQSHSGHSNTELHRQKQGNQDSVERNAILTEFNRKKTGEREKKKPNVDVYGKIINECSGKTKGGSLGHLKEEKKGATKGATEEKIRPACKKTEKCASAVELKFPCQYWEKKKGHEIKKKKRKKGPSRITEGKKIANCKN